jgi:hypothetical protein
VSGCTLLATRCALLTRYGALDFLLRRCWSGATFERGQSTLDHSEHHENESDWHPQPTDFASW